MASESKPCQHCLLEGKDGIAELRCINCELNLCMECVRLHRKPQQESHMYILSDVKSEQLSELVMLLKRCGTKDINNDKNVTPIGKILPGGSTIFRQNERVQLAKEPWRVRQISGCFKEMCQKMQKNKDALEVQGHTMKMGLINGDQLWIRHGDTYSKIAVYDEDLAKIEIIDFKQELWIRNAQQVTEDDVFIATATGLYVCDIKEKHLHKVLDGAYADISVGENMVVVYESNKNLVMFLEPAQSNRMWHENADRSFAVPYDKPERPKSIHITRNNEIIVSLLSGNKSFKFDIMGNLLKEYGTGRPGGSIAHQESYHPSVCGSDDAGNVIVSEFANNLFRIIEPELKWEGVRLDDHKLQHPRDIIVVGSNIYILYGDHDESTPHLKLAKFII